MTLKFTSPVGAKTSLGLSLDAAFEAFDLGIETMFAKANADAEGISGIYYLDGIKHSLYDAICLKDVAADQDSTPRNSVFEIGDASEPSNFSFDVPKSCYETAADATIDTAALFSGHVPSLFPSAESGSAASSNEVFRDKLLSLAETYQAGDLLDGSTLLSGVTAPAIESSTDYSASAVSFAAIGISESLSLIVSGASPVAVADGATVAIDGVSAQSVTFAGSTGTVILDDALAFTGQVSGLAGSDALDLADVSYGANTTATFLGDTTGGTLTITDGTQTANITLVGDYLSSYWTVSSDGHGGTIVVDPTSSNTWQPVNIGEGGFLDGMDIAPDGAMVVRTDTYGAYIWNGSQWQQLVTSTSMPSAFVTPNLDNQGVYEIQIAPSNSNIMYMMFDGYVFETANEGTTWTQTSFAQVTASPNDDYRWYGQKMAIDPDNPDIVYVGTPLNGLFVTTNGGGTWQSVSGVPVSVASNGDSPGITGIEFDPANTNIIFAASYGNGVYETTNGGATWSQLTNGGGPGSVQSAAISSTGVYYVVGDNDTDLWSYANGTWKELLSGLVDAIAINPSNPNNIIVANDTDGLNQSLNGGASWQGWDTNATVSPGDIPWLTDLAPSVGPDALYFNPLDPSQLLSSANDGFWTINVPQTSTTPIVWTSQGIGIEQLVANEIIVPPGGDPVVASWDRGFFYISNAQTVASTFGPAGNGWISAGWSVDYASSDPSFLVEISDGAYVDQMTEESGYSTNGGQTWTPFPTLPPGVGSGGPYTGPWAGSIAASTPDNIVWAPANYNQPYYTLNGGETWNPVVLPGVSSWATFQGSYYANDHDVTADRVLPNTFYMVVDKYGVFQTTNGGVNWTQVYAANPTSGPFYYSGGDENIQSVPGEAGNLFYTQGIEGSSNNPLWQSTNGGVTWNAVANVDAVDAFGFGAAAPGQSYPAIYIVGWVNSVYGIWQSINDAQSWTQIGTYPNNSLDEIKTISGDPDVFGKVYVGFAGSGYAYLSSDGPSVAAIAISPPSGIEEIGSVITLTLAMSEIVTVAGATPTLTLNDGGTATYVGGSGTDALTFNYTVAAGQNAADLTATVANLNGATITDSGGNAANLSLNGLPQVGPQIETAPPAVTGIVDSPGVLEAGGTTTLTLELTQPVTVSGGTPTLTLNDGATAIYTGGSGSDALTFTYTAAVGQTTSSLAATIVNLNGATIADANGNTNLSLSGLTQSGPQVAAASATPTLAIDANNTTFANWAPSSNVTLTTLNPNEVIILEVDAGTSIGSVSDTAGLTWQQRAVVSLNGNFLYEYYAIAPTELSADTVTVNFTGSTTSILNAFSIVGANTSSPFDTNASLPGTPSGSSTVSATTSNANDLIFAAYNYWGPEVTAFPSAGSGWTTISALSGDYYLSEYQMVSAAPSALTATLSSSGGNTIVNGIIDAVVAATPKLGLNDAQVQAAYQAVLQRAPSAGETNATLSIDSTIGNVAAVAVIVDSSEAQYNIYPIMQIIELATGSLPTPAQLAGWVPFVESAGLLQGQSQTNALLDQMAEAFVASTMFGNTYNGGTAVDPNAPITASIVSALIQAATGVAATQAQIDAWVATGLSIDQVFVGFALGDQYTAASQNMVQDYLTATAINGAELSTVDGISATGALTLGTLATPLTGSELMVLGGSGSLTVVTSGNGDTITELNTSTAGGTITASGNNDVINAANGANTITANGTDDTINLGVVSTGTSITAAQTIHASGTGDIITFATKAADGTAVTWAGASTVDGGTSSTGIGANSAVSFGTNTTGGTETVVVTSDLTGATTSGGTSTSGIAMITLGNVVNGQGDQIVFNNATTEVLPGTAAVSVTSAGSLLAKALDLAAADAAASQSGGKIAANTGVIDWFQLGGNTYVVEAINPTSVAATHTALTAADEVVKIVGLVSLSGESFADHTLTL